MKETNFKKVTLVTALAICAVSMSMAQDDLSPWTRKAMALDSNATPHLQLGIVPAAVKQAVAAVAKVAVNESLAEKRSELEAVAKLAKALEQAQIAWNDFYAELLREERRRLIDAEIAWRMQALLEEQDEEQAVLLLLAEM